MAIKPITNSIQYSGKIPAVSENERVRPSGQTVQFTGKQPSLKTVVPVEKGQINIVGQTIPTNYRVVSSGQNINYQSNAPTIIQNYRIQVGVGNVSVNSNDVNLRLSEVIRIPVTNISVSGKPPAARINYRLLPQVNSVVFKGSKLSKSNDDVVSETESGRIDYSSIPPVILKGRTITVPSINYSFIGQEISELKYGLRNFDYDYYKDVWITPTDREVNNVATDPIANVGVQIQNTSSGFSYSLYRKDYQRDEQETITNTANVVIGTVGTANNSLSGRYTYSHYQDIILTPEADNITNTANVIIGIVGTANNSGNRMDFTEYRNQYYTPEPETVNNVSSDNRVQIGEDEEEFIY